MSRHRSHEGIPRANGIDHGDAMTDDLLKPSLGQDDRAVRSEGEDG
ncbi:MAG: hypothetical protein AVDCRST_MAG59-3283 [uncultured Thermomicrobiales bacterium]|uniref:Uncharacterized protein n=1 Tax=uncultured Thermomicrobiales bacterium TaxID=1645740 RepID=A0A6J4V6X2_9BACT|nr:MAG: hypothetical protein AVDCRST_MAG59-3283 [uncultured Thermomicrobiales bacterium]